MNKNFNRILLQDAMGTFYSEVNPYYNTEPVATFDSWVKAWVYKTFCHGGHIVPAALLCKLK